MGSEINLALSVRLAGRNGREPCYEVLRSKRCFAGDAEGAPRKHHIAIAGSQIAQPSDEFEVNGTMGFP